MIGRAYWSTGILFREERGGWVVWLDFLDDGFAEFGASEGTLRIRYVEPDLTRAIDTLREDAKRFGILLRGPTGGTATVYVKNDGELEDGDRPDLRREANRQARRLGWTPCYSREYAEATT